jgi:hypothetical protein
VAELARRIALNLLGGQHLALGGADNSLPIRADLGRGELPFTSVALGFRVLGLSAWAGRLPLALWLVASLAALYASLSALWSQRGALYACLVLATLPVCFIQSRTLLGDAVTLSTFTLAWSGFAAACFGSRLRARVRVAFAMLGVVGLYAGFWCRGPLVNVAVPALSVGLAALFSRPTEALVRRLALGLAVVGVLAVALGYQGLALVELTHEYSVFVGSSASAPGVATFDTALGELIHASFPWSAALPLALALLVQASPAAGQGAPDVSVELGPADAGRLDAPAALPRPVVNAAGLALGLGLAAAALLARPLGQGVALPALVGLAVLIGGALVEVDAGRFGSPVLGLVGAAAGVAVGFDLHAFPDKTLAPFGLSNLSMPEAVRETWSPFWLTSSVALGVVLVVALYESSERGAAGGSAFRASEYAAVLQRFQTLWDGNLLFALLLLEAALVGTLVLSAVSERLVPLPGLDALGTFTRKAAAWGAISLPFAPLAPLAGMWLRDVGRLIFDGQGSGKRALGRGQGILLALTCVAGIESAGFYPAVTRQLSPREAVERYRELAQPGEPLGFIGQRSEGPRYQGVTAFESFSDASRAFAWLVQNAEQRRWLVVRRSDLPEINARYREQQGRNVPVLDARSSELLLLSSRAGKLDESPLADLVLDAPPALQHPVSALLGDKLEVLGWDIQSIQGQPLSQVSPGTRFRFIVYYRVQAALAGTWQTFVHFDGLQRRFNADHEPLEGRYPMRFWRQKDVIVDRTEVLLEPNFSAGDYQVYFGLFQGERRLQVTAGRHVEDRVVGGVLSVQ